MPSLHYLISLLVLISINLNFYSCLTPEQIEEVKRIVEVDFMSTNLIPGVGLSVVGPGENGDEVSYANGYGLQDVENSIPVTNKTRFGIASVTKVSLSK